MTTKPLDNPRWERFALLVAMGSMSLTKAFQQAGYSCKSASTNAAALAKKEPVASRIATLRSTPPADLAGKILTRNQILQLLTGLAQDGKSEMTKLKAIELLSKLQGYNEPERLSHQHVHMHVDASLIAELRSGYAALAERSAQASLVAPIGAGAGGPQSEATLAERKGIPPLPLSGESPNLDTPI